MAARYRLPQRVALVGRATLLVGYIVFAIVLYVMGLWTWMVLALLAVLQAVYVAILVRLRD